MKKKGIIIISIIAAVIVGFIVFLFIKKNKPVTTPPNSNTNSNSNTNTNLSTDKVLFIGRNTKRFQIWANTKIPNTMAQLQVDSQFGKYTSAAFDYIFRTGLPKTDSELGDYLNQMNIA